MSNNGLLIPFEKEPNELYPDFILRVQITLETISKTGSLKKNEAEIQKKIAEKKINIKYS